MKATCSIPEDHHKEFLNYIKIIIIFSFPTKPTPVGLYGMCKGLSSKVDIFFMLDMKSFNIKKGLVFTGIKKTEMLINQKTNRWNIISVGDKSVIMELDIEVNYISFNILFVLHRHLNSEKTSTIWTLKMENTIKYLWRWKVISGSYVCSLLW